MPDWGGGTLEAGPVCVGFADESNRRQRKAAWDGGFAPGLDPAHRDYASFAHFSDPDGNSRVLQERGYRTA